MDSLYEYTKQASNQANQNCCRKDCLYKHMMKDQEFYLKTMVGCKKEIEGLSMENKHILLKSKIESCIFKTTTRQYRFKWKIGTGEYQIGEDLCRNSFSLAYNCSSSFLDRMSVEIKGIQPNITLNVFKDTKNYLLNSKELKDFNFFSEKYGIELTPEQLAALNVPNTGKALNCYGWMYSHFNLIGDAAPNKDNELHIEPILIKDVHSEYVDAMIYGKKLFKLFLMSILY